MPWRIHPSPLPSMNISRRFLLKLAPLLFWRRGMVQALAAEPGFEAPFSAEFPQLESLTTGEWWKKAGAEPKKAGKGGQPQILSMDVPRDEVVCFAYYTQQNGVLKMSAQLFPLKPGEERVARLEVKRGDGTWQEIARSPVLYPGWDAHFRVEGWDGSKTVGYRVLHGAKARFEGGDPAGSCGEGGDRRGEHELQLEPDHGAAHGDCGEPPGTGS